MIYEIIKSQDSSDGWRIEGINYEKDGEIYVTVFSGPLAEKRAKEYMCFLEGN